MLAGECSDSGKKRPVEDTDEIARLYRVGYGDGSIYVELDGWGTEGVWPDG